VAHHSRRDVLRLGLAITLVGLPTLAGCTLSDPTIEVPVGTSTLEATPIDASGSPSSSATPTATPTISGAQRGSELEIGLADLAVAISRRSGLSKDRRAMLADIADAHRAHARALSDWAPTKPAASPAGSAPALFTQLTRRERAVAGRYKRTALASSGADALLWSSLSLAATGFAAVSDTSTSAVGRLRSPKPAAVLSDTQATQELVRQLHGVIYGYQLAIGTMPASNGSRNRALRELQQHRVIRDRLIAWLIRRSSDVPAAEAAYAPSVNLTNGRSAEKLIMKMLIALQPFCGLSIAAADDRDRERAFDLLASTIVRAKGWGAPLDAWPGYA
jgi:hypothetical protein